MAKTFYGYEKFNLPKDLWENAHKNHQNGRRIPSGKSSNFCYNHIFIENIDNVVENFTKVSYGENDYIKSYIPYDHIKQIRDENEELLKKDFKPNIEQIKEHYIFNEQRDLNIGHYIHKLIMTYSVWRKNKKKILYYSWGVKFKDDLIENIFSKEFIIKQKYNTIYSLEDCIRIPWLGRNLKCIPALNNVMSEMRENCFNNLDIKPKRELTVFYDRSDLSRKNIVNVSDDFFCNNNIMYIKDLSSNYSFKGTVNLLSKVKKLIIPVGSSCFNFLFLDKESSVMELNPHNPNSWAQKFGMSCLIGKHIIYVSHNTIKYEGKGQGGGGDDHMKFDEKLKREIINF